jgi:uncharacterized protein (DUF1330 family)
MMHASVRMTATFLAILPPHAPLVSLPCPFFVSITRHHCREGNRPQAEPIQYALPLAVAIGLGFGAVAIRGARTTTPPVYVVVEIDEITDANGFEALRQTADTTAVEVQSEDGRYFARTENVTALDGSAPKVFAFIAFDNTTKAKAFNDSMKNTTALRTRVTKSRSFIVEGTMR